MDNLSYSFKKYLGCDFFCLKKNPEYSKFIIQYKSDYWWNEQCI